MAGRCSRSFSGSIRSSVATYGSSNSWPPTWGRGFRARLSGTLWRELKTTGPLWQLKVNCLRYCRFVHAHHGAEDVLLFPALRAVDPSIGPVVDRLEADHARVSDLLDVVEAAARELTDTDGGDARRRVIEGLQDLHGHLLEHLDYEERNAGPTIRRLDRLALA